jgi:hypothetical protein
MNDHLFTPDQQPIYTFFKRISISGSGTQDAHSTGTRLGTGWVADFQQLDVVGTLS